MKLELRKRPKGGPIEVLVILPVFQRCPSRRSGLDSFHRRLLAVEERIFVFLSRILIAYGDLSTSMFYLVCFMIYRKTKLNAFSIILFKHTAFMEIRFISGILLQFTIILGLEF